MLCSTVNAIDSECQVYLGTFGFTSRTRRESLVLLSCLSTRIIPQDDDFSDFPASQESEMKELL